MKNNHTMLTLLVLFAFSLPAAGQNDPRWALFAGKFDTDGASEAGGAAELGLEYRLAPVKIKNIEITPAMGLASTSDNAFWLYGSLRYDWRVSKRWLVTPQVGISLFEDNDGKDLGGPIEFRSGLEISYQFNGGTRLGALFYHLSNAGIYTPNPGSNSLVLTWAFGN